MPQAAQLVRGGAETETQEAWLQRPPTDCKCSEAKQSFPIHSRGISGDKLDEKNDHYVLSLWHSGILCGTERNFLRQSSVLPQTLARPGLRLIKDQASGEMQAPGEVIGEELVTFK